MHGFCGRGIEAFGSPPLARWAIMRALDNHRGPFTAKKRRFHKTKSPFYRLNEPNFVTNTMRVLG